MKDADASRARSPRTNDRHDRVKAGSPPPTVIAEGFIETARARLSNDQPLRRTLPIWGRVHIDRQLPFLCIYRRPPGVADPGTERLLMGQASYLIAPGARPLHRGLSSLVTGIAQTLTEGFGSFLIFEVWARLGEATEPGAPIRVPAFRILTPRENRLPYTVEALERALGEIRIKKVLAQVEVVSEKRIAPPGLIPLVLPEQVAPLGWHLIGIEVRPVYRDSETGQSFPLIRRVLHRGLSRALKRGIFEFTQHHTTHRPPHYHALGRRSVVKAVWEVDRELAQVSDAFDLLLQVTPTNIDAAWRKFRRERFERAPEFVSRPLPFDPGLVKRQLFQVPMERIEDPTLAQLFRDQQFELDGKLTMLANRGTPRFLYGSLQVFGGVDEPLLKLALEVLERVPARSREGSTRGFLKAQAFAARAEEEIARYREVYPKVSTRVEIRDDVSGLLVSHGNLLIGSQTMIPLPRVDPLLQHEIGTHVVTYFNGRAQPLRQLYVGLPGYEEMQEGLAVLAEYLVGGLSRPRLRLLAGRVLAVRHLIEGASFIETFRELTRDQDFAARGAFIITMRVYRGGGFTKDAVYLRGLVRLLDYLKQGGALEPLVVGKIGPAHLDIVRELQWREVLVPIPLRPHYFDRPEAKERLKRLRQGLSTLDLIGGREGGHHENRILRQRH